MGCSTSMEHLDDTDCQRLAEFFALYSNVTRLRIFCGLREGKKTVSELADYSKVTLQNTSQHLRLMRSQGAVRADKQGQHVIYSIVDKRFAKGAQLIRDALFVANHSNTGKTKSKPKKR